MRFSAFVLACVACMDNALAVNTLAQGSLEQDAKNALSALLFAMNPSSAIRRHSAAAARKKPARMDAEVDAEVKKAVEAFEAFEALSVVDKVSSIYNSPDIPKDDKPVLLMAALVGQANFDKFMTASFTGDEVGFVPRADGLTDFHANAAEAEEEARVWLYENTKDLYSEIDAEYEAAEKDRQALERTLTSEALETIDKMVPSDTSVNVGEGSKSDEEVKATAASLAKVLQASQNYDKSASEFLDGYQNYIPLDRALEDFLDQIESSKLNDDGIEQEFNRLSSVYGVKELSEELEAKILTGEMSEDEFQKEVGDDEIDEETIALRELAGMNDPQQADLDDFIKTVKSF